MEPTPAPAPAPVPAPVTFTQEEVDRIRAEEFGKGKRLGSEASTLAKQERERLALLEKDAADRAKADETRRLEVQKRGDFEKSRELIIKSAQDEKVKEYEPKLTAAQERIAKLEGRFGGMLNDKIKAAAAGKAYNPDQVVALLSGRRVRLNADLEPEVLDEAGEPALVGGKPMSIDQLVDGYLAANPNLVKSSGGQPGGSGGGASLRAGEQGEIATLQAEVDAAAKRYMTTKQNADLTIHRAAVKKLNDAKAKAGT